ncbi:MAG: hypothetical protein ACMXYK_02955 [Candidatus Woesearchaeota archaeon]
MKPAAYRSLCEPLLKTWLANHIGLEPRHHGIDLVGKVSAMELKTHDTFWKKNGWAFNKKECTRYYQNHKGKDMWFAAMQYAIAKRPSAMRTQYQIARNLRERETWLIPWEFILEIEPSQETKDPWLYINKKKFQQKYAFITHMKTEWGDIYIPKDYAHEKIG